MKIAITGHTSGLGRSLSEYAIMNGHIVVGFSKSTGYDITSSTARQSIISSITDCDVFINNAYDKFGQLELLYDVYNKWKSNKKLIVTVGSMASNAAEWRLQPCMYSTIKKALDVATYQLVNSHDRNGCKLMIFKPGYLGDSDGKIPYDYAAKFLLDAVDNNMYETIELVLRP
jgi:NAD(P)-dependent dehydrogenase (short-subunit alcohol dehydrogenase family)